MNSTLPANNTHPINKWTNSKSFIIPMYRLAVLVSHMLNLCSHTGSIAITGLHPSSSLGYTNYLYAQLADETIHGWNISFNAESTAFVPGDTFQIQGLAGLPGTHLTVTSLSNPSGGA